MSLQQSMRQIACAATRSRRRTSKSLADLYEPISRLCLCQHQSRRSYHASPILREPAISGLRKDDEMYLTAPQRAAAAAKRARQKLKVEEQKTQAGMKQGSLAPTSIFAEEISQQESVMEAIGLEEDAKKRTEVIDPLANRNFAHLSFALNPRPTARSRWQRRMVIRSVHRSGRLSKAETISRSEREHLSRSHFFKTSMKKLAPLARQIAGKSIDEAILQMRFSSKKAARDVRQHLMQARNEAIVIRGMGLGLPSPDSTDFPVLSVSDTIKLATSSDASTDPAFSHALSTQNPSKSIKPGIVRNSTDIYIAQAWTNRGPYGQAPDYRAKGQLYMMRPPHTGISILLKEEKTRTREKMEKEAKVIRKRLGKRTMWTQMPDRMVVRQSQHMLW